MAATQRTVDPDWTQAIDAIMAPACAPDAPGAAVIATRDGQTLFRQGYGLANLELGVPVEPHMIFRIGSVTKQFTAVCILMLAEQGTLSLADPITRFLPDYPMHGHTITVEHLLTHTSGIKSYTDMAEWMPLWRKDVTLREVIDLFKEQPPEFAPGERFAYCNSGYILLGAIIEQASGMTYEEFLDRHIFQPLGMGHTSYDHTERVIPGRVPGYQKSGDGWEHAPYLSMTQPHAAGALVSSVDDLALWDEALSTARLLKQETLQRAFTSATLANGEPTDYGYGWAISSYQGHRIVEHGGGINGFLCNAKRLLDDRLFVAVLMNSTAGDPDMLAMKITALLLGHPYQEPAPVTLDRRTLDDYVGVYQAGEKDEFVVTRDDAQLSLSSAGGDKQEIFPASVTEFFQKKSFLRLTFARDAAGVVTTLELHGRGRTRVAKRTDKPVPTPRQAIALDPTLYDRYAGRYAVSPAFILTLTRDGDHLMAQATGQPKLELFPESPTNFFYRAVDAQIVFEQDASGAVTGLVLHQAGRALPGRKIG